MRSSHVVLDQVDVAFDDERAVANAGLLLPATLAERLGLEQAADTLVDLGERPGAARPGRKILTVVHSLVAGGDCFDDVELLRAGATASVSQRSGAGLTGETRVGGIGCVAARDFSGAVSIRGPLVRPVGARVDRRPRRMRRTRCRSTC